MWPNFLLKFCRCRVDETENDIDIDFRSKINCCNRRKTIVQLSGSTKHANYMLCKLADLDPQSLESVLRQCKARTQSSTLGKSTLV